MLASPGLHSGSLVTKELLDAAVHKVVRIRTLFFTAHVHNYQRFTRTMDDQQFTYIVAGAGGYWRHPMAEFMSAKVTPPFRQEDGPEVVLENYVDDTHGFMRVEIENDLIVSFLGSKPSSSDEERLEPFFGHRLTP